MADDEAGEGGAQARSGGGGAATWLILGLAVVLVLGLISVRCAFGPDVARSYPSRTLPPEPEATLLPPPEMNDEYAPCSDCHEGEPTDPTPRELEDDHDETVLAHGDLWCLSCHDTRRQRHACSLADTGRSSGFEESWLLCTQCHGEKLRGLASRRARKAYGALVGARRNTWNCVSCHDRALASLRSPSSPSPRPVLPSDDTSGRSRVRRSGGSRSDEGE